MVDATVVAVRDSVVGALDLLVERYPHHASAAKAIILEKPTHVRWRRCSYVLCSLIQMPGVGFESRCLAADIRAICDMMSRATYAYSDPPTLARAASMIAEIVEMRRPTDE